MEQALLEEAQEQVEAGDKAAVGDAWVVIVQARDQVEIAFVQVAEKRFCISKTCLVIL